MVRKIHRDGHFRLSFVQPLASLCQLGGGDVVHVIHIKAWVVILRLPPFIIRRGWKGKKWVPYVRCRAVWHPASGLERWCTQHGGAMAEAAERRRRRLRVKSLAVLSDLIELSPDELFKAIHR